MEKNFNPFMTHWDNFKIHQVMDGYCLEVSNYDGTCLESDVAPTLETLLTAMVPLICYGRNVSMYEKMSGFVQMSLTKAVGVRLVTSSIYIRLGYPYYHYISGRYAFQEDISDNPKIPILNSQEIGTRIAAMLLAA